MSKLSGKQNLKNGESVKYSFDFEKKIRKKGLLVRYLKCSDSFEFKGYRLSKEVSDYELKQSGIKGGLREIGENKGRDSVVVKSNVLSAMILIDKNDDFVYKWSLGYVVREKKTDLNEIMNSEFSFIDKVCGEGTSALLNFDDYTDLSVWQSIYAISETILVKARRKWKQKKWGKSSDSYVNVPLLGSWGGSRIRASHSEKSKKVLRINEIRDELERIKHNKKVAVLKRVYGWYEEAYREECKLNGIKFSTENCLKSWRELT